MASITKRPNGCYTVQIYLKKGTKTQTKIHLPTKNRREAERICDHIQALADSLKTGTQNPEAVQWAARLGESDADLYGKLEKLGLVKERRQKNRTLADLVELFVAHNGGKPGTKYRYESTGRLLVELLGNVPVDSITTEDAARVVTALKTEPLNRRTKTPRPFSKATLNRGIVRIKTIFRFAEQIDWIKRSPFRFASGGETVNQTKWHYVPFDVFLKVLDHCKQPKWRLILALGRFCGIRGASEVHKMIWGDVDFDQKTVVIRAGKKEGKKDELRTVPMNSVVQKAFLEWKPEDAKQTDRVFPLLGEGVNFSTMAAKYIRWAGLDPWPEPWYNNRRSFCSDIMEAGVDPKIYEAVCGHSFQMGMSHYQILHPDRQSKGYDKIRITLEPTAE